MATTDPSQIVALADLEHRLAEACHDLRCIDGTECDDRAAHIIWPHGEDAKALAPFVAELLAEQRERIAQALDAKHERAKAYHYRSALKVAAAIVRETP